MDNHCKRLLQWDCINALKERYRSSSVECAAMLHQQRVFAKQQAGEKMPEFLSLIEGYFRELKPGFGETVSDVIVIGILLQAWRSLEEEHVKVFFSHLRTTSMCCAAWTV
jgi:hypothetical protein